MLSDSILSYIRREVIHMTDTKKPTQQEIDKLAESVFAVTAERQQFADSQAKKLDVTASFVRSKLAIQ